MIKCAALSLQVSFNFHITSMMTKSFLRSWPTNFHIFGDFVLLRNPHPGQPHTSFLPSAGGIVGLCHAAGTRLVEVKATVPLQFWKCSHWMEDIDMDISYQYREYSHIIYYHIVLSPCHLSIYLSIYPSISMFTESLPWEICVLYLYQQI